MANKKNDPNHLGFGRLMAWKSSDIAMAGLNVIVLGYLSIYCSDTLGIAPAVVGTVLMVSKIIDAFTDIFAGWLVDNTHTKLGKGRPYELAIVGVMLCSLGLFSGSPAWSNTLKVVWIFCMYTLVFSIFTTLRGAANTPYTIRHFSNNPILIRKVASYGGVITMAGSMIVSILFPIVMSKLATSAGGWRTTVAIFVLPLLLISLLRFFFCKEDPSVDGGDEQFQPVRLNEIFSRMLSEVALEGNDDLQAVVKRYAFLVMRISMIQARIRQFEANDGAPDIYCEDVDFDRSLQIVLCCYEHSRLLLSSMPSSQLHPLKDPNSTRKFIGELPETFTTEDAMQIGVKYDFSHRKISRLIKSFIGVKINKISHGKYQKIS